jgi:hypothetical protein
MENGAHVGVAKDEALMTFLLPSGLLGGFCLREDSNWDPQQVQHPPPQQQRQKLPHKDRSPWAGNPQGNAVPLLPSELYDGSGIDVPRALKIDPSLRPPPLISDDDHDEERRLLCSLGWRMIKDADTEFGGSSLPADEGGLLTDREKLDLRIMGIMA